MSIEFSLIAKRETSMNSVGLEKIARLRGLGEDVPTKYDCKVFNDLFSGEPMREIAVIYYSPRYVEKRGGAWRLKFFHSMTESDRCVALEVINNLISKGAGAVKDWEQKPFSDRRGVFFVSGICRPLSDYEGEELYTMVNLPADVEAAAFLSAVEKVMLPVGLETIAFETRSSDVGVQL